MNMGIVARATTEGRVSGQRRENTKLNNRPNLAEPWCYVETGLDEFDTGQSPEWLNDFYFVEGSPVAFRHGLDGQLDMIGVYDLTLGAVSGDTAFILPVRWRGESIDTFFPLELEPDVWSAAVQTIDGDTGVVKIFWPIVATPYP